MCVLIRHTFCKKFGGAVCYQTQMPSIFVIFFLDIEQCFHPATKNRVENIKNPVIWPFFDRGPFVVPAIC